MDSAGESDDQKPKRSAYVESGWIPLVTRFKDCLQLSIGLHSIWLGFPNSAIYDEPRQVLVKYAETKRTNREAYSWFEIEGIYKVDPNLPFYEQHVQEERHGRGRETPGPRENITHCLLSKTENPGSFGMIYSLSLSRSPLVHVIRRRCKMISSAFRRSSRLKLEQVLLASCEVGLDRVENL